MVNENTFGSLFGVDIETSEYAQYGSLYGFRITKSVTTIKRLKLTM